MYIFFSIVTIILFHIYAHICLCKMYHVVEALTELLNHGASVMMKNHITGATPLHCALQSTKEPASKRAECVKLLIGTSQNHINEDLIQCTDNYEATALDYLLEEDYMYVQNKDFITSMTELLQTNNKKQTELFQMIERFDDEAIKNFFVGRDNVDEKILEEREQKNGMTPLLVAVESLTDLCKTSEGSEIKMTAICRIIQTLIENGCNSSALPQIKVYGRKIGPDQNILMTENTEKETKSSQDSSLHKVCSTLAALYVAKTIDNCSTADKKITFLEQIGKLLVNNGTLIFPPITNQIVHDCARRGNLQMVKFLIQTLRINPNTPGRQGMTPLHFASRSGRSEIVEWLIQYKPNTPDENTAVDLKITDDRDKTALDAAIANDRREVITLLTKLET